MKFDSQYPYVFLKLMKEIYLPVCWSCSLPSSVCTRSCLLLSLWYFYHLVSNPPPIINNFELLSTSYKYLVIYWIITYYYSKSFQYKSMCIVIQSPFYFTFLIPKLSSTVVKFKPRSSTSLPFKVLSDKRFLIMRNKCKLLNITTY